MVGHTDGPLEREDHPNEGSGVDHRLRRLGNVLGGNIPGTDTGGPWSKQEKTLHINCLYRTAGSNSGSKDVCKEQNHRYCSS